MAALLKVLQRQNGIFSMHFFRSPFVAPLLASVLRAGTVPWPCTNDKHTGFVTLGQRRTAAIYEGAIYSLVCISLGLLRRKGDAFFSFIFFFLYRPERK